jgi:hypothetical protein
MNLPITSMKRNEGREDDAISVSSTSIQMAAGTLLSGIKDMLNDEHFQALAKDLYQHASISPGTSLEEEEPR